jgi:hypothetical protein
VTVEKLALRKSSFHTLMNFRRHILVQVSPARLKDDEQLPAGGIVSVGANHG